MTTLQELKQERERFKNIVKLKKHYLQRVQQVIDFYTKQVEDLDRKIKELECQNI